MHYVESARKQRVQNHDILEVVASEILEVVASNSEGAALSALAPISWTRKYGITPRFRAS